MNAGSEVMRSNGPPQSPRKVGRKRRVAGWLLATAGVIVAALWVASGWWGCEWNSADERVLFALRPGVLCWQLDEIPAVSPSPGWHVEMFNQRQPLARWFGWGEKGVEGYNRVSRDQCWGIVHVHPGSTYKMVSIAFWPIPLLLWTPAALLLRSGILARRRAVKGMCAKGGCGYSLAGLAPDAPCPECGTVRSGAERMNAGSEAVRSNGPLHNSDGGTK